MFIKNKHKVYFIFTKPKLLKNTCFSTVHQILTEPRYLIEVKMTINTKNENLARKYLKARKIIGFIRSKYFYLA